MFNGKFYVMVWQNECNLPTYPILEKRLISEGIPVIRVPNNEDGNSDLIPYDNHPNASGHDRAAKYLWNSLKSDIINQINEL